MTLKELEVLKNKAIAESDKNVKTITTYIQSLVADPIRVNINNSYKNDWSFTIEALDQNGDRYFGGDLSVSYESKYDWDKKKQLEPELRMDCSSSGRTSRRENYGKVVRVMLAAALWAHEEEFGKLLTGLPHSDNDAYTGAHSKYNQEQKELAARQKAEKEQAIWNQLVVGYTCKSDTDRYTLQKITPKRVYFVHERLEYNYKEEFYVEKNALMSALLNDEFTVATLPGFYKQGIVVCH